MMYREKRLKYFRQIFIRHFCHMCKYEWINKQQETHCPECKSESISNETKRTKYKKFSLLMR